MIAGGFDPSSLIGPGISAVGGLLGGIFGDDPPPPGATMWDKNRNLATALMKAILNRKMNLPKSPGLPNFNAQPGTAAGMPSLASKYAQAKGY